MSMQLVSRSFGLLLLSIMSLGFRVLPQGNSWSISKQDPKLWLEFCNVPQLRSTQMPVDDPLFGVAISFDTAVNSIVSDFNNVLGSFVELALVASDPDYTDELGINRRIKICFADLPGGAGGHAKSIWKTGRIVGCEILMESSVLDSTYAFVLTLTHEIGHCLGLDHPQETIHSIMSYYVDLNEPPRLKLDDKMGTTFLYPVDRNAIKESPTFGLSCST